ncbi:hypothetical protein [Ruficoccus sp. ZRK36]|uniref:hypothetical protein n=1 Tax=Ruficoccus sp. ZRK36 TaxID=2866311 RepID=UPI001C731891|nr:hypothetical protein [Ruficoccus sp. ZRK36]QYY34319.1 hypothetical protein K0V07_08305 [Ruficoccus sp. ZRK36]
MKINWYKAILAGVIGTLLFDITGFLFTGTWWDIPHVLADAVGVPFAVALLMHYGNGVALAAIYAALSPSLIGPGWLRALFFTSLETVMLVWFLLFPLLGLGIAGLEGGVIFPVLSMARHWLYAIPLAYCFREESPDGAMSCCSKKAAEATAC